MKLLFLALLLTLASFPVTASAHVPSSHSRSAPRSSRSARCTSCTRDAHGRIARSREARAEFKREHPCPSTGKGSGACPGYVVDHVEPLKRGGADSPENMQWQTKEAAKAKDRTE